MKCKDCCYYWADFDEKTGETISKEYCHYYYNDGYAPCEVDDNDNETEDVD